MTVSNEVERAAHVGTKKTDGPIEPIPRSERLWILNEEHGMTADSPEEIDAMYAITHGYKDAQNYIRAIATHNGNRAHDGVIDGYNDKVKQLNHPLTLAFQIKAGFVDPDGKQAAQIEANKAGMAAARHAMMGVAENFLDYLNDANTARDSLYRFDQSLDAENIDQDAKLGDIDLEFEMNEDPDTRRAIGAVTRYVEGFLFANGVGEDYTKTDYMSDDPDVVRRIVETVGEIDVRLLREIIKTVRDLQLARKNFWTVQLVGQPADDENGIPFRIGINSINDAELQRYVESSLGDIYRGEYKKDSKTQ